MPLYEYQCEACGHKFELIRKFSDPPVETCPSCSSGTVQKLQSASAFQFKGTGWYVTDYARKGAGRTGQTPSAKLNGASSDAPSTPREAADKNPSAASSSLQPTPASSSAPAAPAAPASEKSS
jgi:putative FmdB family regulatory protein